MEWTLALLVVTLAAAACYSRPAFWAVVFCAWLLGLLPLIVVVILSVCHASGHFWLGVAGRFRELHRVRQLRDRRVPEHIEEQVARETMADCDFGGAGIPVDDDGKLTMRVGVALRIAKEVKLRFGGTPKYTEANWLLAARYVADACAKHRITRELDQWTVLCKARPLVFTRLYDERVEQQWLNSQSALHSHDLGSGWHSNGLRGTWWSQVCYLFTGGGGSGHRTMGQSG